MDACKSGTIVAVKEKMKERVRSRRGSDEGEVRLEEDAMKERVRLKG